jgi:hypothetical protein
VDTSKAKNPERTGKKLENANFFARFANAEKQLKIYGNQENLIETIYVILGNVKGQMLVTALFSASNSTFIDFIVDERERQRNVFMFSIRYAKLRVCASCTILNILHRPFFACQRW